MLRLKDRSSTPLPSSWLDVPASWLPTGSARFFTRMRFWCFNMERSGSGAVTASSWPSRASISACISFSSAARRCVRSRDINRLPCYKPADTFLRFDFLLGIQSMIHLEIGGERFAIAAGETAIGSASDNGVILAGEGVQPRHAVVQASPPGSAAIQAADAEAEVRVNGVKLGAEPTPLLHGDKIAIGSHELRVVDSTRGGSTQLFDSGAFSDLLPPKSSKPAAGTTGGRLVCLTDGREYAVGDRPLTLGLDASSNVVVSGHDVSRQHAEIRADPQGYVLVDLSVNGTYVNGERIGKTHPLARADVIRIGNDEFRFYADVSPPTSAPDPVPSVPTTSPPVGATHRLSDTLHDIPVVRPGAELERRTTPP